MKITTFAAVLLLSLLSNYTYAYNEWVPCETIPTPPQVYVPSVPLVTYTTQQVWVPRPMILAYEWVPYYTTKTTVLERYGLICKYRTVIREPAIEWIYQPVWK